MVSDGTARLRDLSASLPDQATDAELNTPLSTGTGTSVLVGDPARRGITPRCLGTTLNGDQKRPCSFRRHGKGGAE